MMNSTRRDVETCPVTICVRVDGRHGDVGTSESFHVYQLGNGPNETIKHLAFIQKLVDVKLTITVHFAVV